MADALVVWHLGKRCTSQDHSESVGVFHQLMFSRGELNQNGKRLSKLLDFKNVAEYEERSLTQRDWETTEPLMSRFLGWATTKLPP